MLQQKDFSITLTFIASIPTVIKAIEGVYTLTQVAQF